MMAFNKLQEMKTPIAVLVSGLLIAFAVLFSLRYQVAVTPDGDAVRLDRLTGNVDACPFHRTSDRRIVLDCSGRR